MPIRRKPETLVLIVALVGTLTVLGVFLADLAVSRHRDLENGERRLQHFGIMMSEHTARAFEAVDTLLRETSTDLTRNRREWENWDERRGWEYIAQRHSRAMPQLRDLIIFDRYGNQRFISSYLPAPRINVKDRPYFKAIDDGAESSYFGPYVSRNTGNYTYGLARRLANESGRFSGIVFAAIEPSYFQDFCWPNRLSDEFEAVLITARGEIVASCRPTDLSRQSPILGSLAENVLFSGKLRKPIPESGVTNSNGFLVSASPVPGFVDLRILTAIPEKTLLAAWRNHLFELGTLALLVTVVLVVGALMVRRQVGEMSAMTAELAANQEHLAERILTATEQLARQKDAAERANAAKSRFLAAASHDLRQPLHALSLFSTDLLRQIRSGSTKELPRLAEQIGTSTAVLSELLDSLLDISRLDVAGIKPDRRPSALQAIFDRVAESFRRAAADRNITLRLRPTTYWVDSDPVMLERMIANLVSNALRYSPPGSRVLVAARWRDSDVVIQVRDNGIGIAKEHQAAIFAEFFQVGNTAREQNKGLGLGLSIVDRLSRALNISVSLESRIGEGTTFSLRVATCPPAVANPPAEPITPSLPRVHCVGQSDDLRECTHLIERWDYAVSSGNDVVERPPADAILVVDDGQAEAASRSVPHGTPLIVLVHDPAIPLPAGAHALPLPVRPARLRALLGQLQKTLSKSMP